MLFDDRLTERDIIKAKKAGREVLLESIVSDFRKTFPNIAFELNLESRNINAIAMSLQDKRRVTVYGGLALHPKLGAHSLTFVFLHETGHHLADGCRLVRDPALACECAADHWAVTIGSAQLWKQSGRCCDMETALSELSVIMGTGQMSQPKYSGKKEVCWAKAWDLRRRAMRQRTPAPTATGSCVAYF